ncbi:MAG: GNAT family N-acetyltransferase [Chloroflexota bacterium]|nr:GNAT family N-acetyltransferase [Chloroflexota bacterium]
MITTLPEGFTARPPTMEDTKAVAVLFAACEIADTGQPETTEADIRLRWQAPGVDLEKDALVVVTSNGDIIGFISIRARQDTRIYISPMVLPAYREQGIETYLVRKAEERARQYIASVAPEMRVVMITDAAESNAQMRQLLEQEGFTQVRSTWCMEMEMNEAPPDPIWPANITVRTFVKGQDDRATFDADDEAFHDHWGYLPADYEQWKYRNIDREGFDPSLWFLAYDGNEIAGLSLCLMKPQLGWVDDLAVRRPWRRSGLGLALLHHTFGEFYHRGIHTVGLYVDTQNLTGATRLYKRAGMHIAWQSHDYEKELRAGVDVSVRTLAV